MKTRLILRPGSRGTKKLLAQYGRRLICVRYRYDERLKRRYKTIELIVDEAVWEPGPPAGTMVGVRIRFEEEALRRRIKEAGGRWEPGTRLWRIRYNKAVKLGLRNRIVDGKSI